MLAHPSEDTLITIDRSRRTSRRRHAVVTGLALDVVFPVLHGPFGEDGTVQGLLELANVPYVGAGVMASAVGMDKAAMKVLFAARGLPVAPWYASLAADWRARRGEVARRASLATRPAAVREAGQPRLERRHLEGEDAPRTLRAGHRAGARSSTARSSSRPACRTRARSSARCSATTSPQASVAGEIIPSREFYDYEAKYLDDGSRTVIPRRSHAGSSWPRCSGWRSPRSGRSTAAGMSRVDFLLSRTTGDLLLNEINTIPGFTTISMFAKLWEASGVTYPALVDRLIELALERHQEKQRLRTSAL